VPWSLAYRSCTCRASQLRMGEANDAGWSLVPLASTPLESDSWSYSPIPVRPSHTADLELDTEELIFFRADEEQEEPYPRTALLSSSTASVEAEVGSLRSYGAGARCGWVADTNMVTWAWRRAGADPRHSSGPA
jgi:hypothetical protein